MNEQATLEIIAPTIDEAVSKGLEELGLPLDAVDVEILDEGNRGLFGIGSRQARVRLTVKTETGESRAPTRPPAQEPSAPPPEAAPARPAEAPRPATPSPERAPEQPARRQIGDILDDEDVLAIARETVSELLEKMHIGAEVTARLGEGEDTRRRPVIVDIEGKDLSILIGRKAATLNALQYVARLIVGKELGRGILLIVDVEGYRKRREQQLRRLARQMADQAVNTGRRQILEPMPPNERRIVHIELREDERVTTESVGEDPSRKVTILPAASQ